MNLVFKKKIRNLKNIRSVYNGLIDNNKCIIKCFYSQRDYKKELNGILLLNSSNISTPQIFFNGKWNNKWIIATKEISHSQSVFDFLQKEKSIQQKNKIAYKVLMLNNKMIKNNLIQYDNYLKNYLIDKKHNIFVIDGGQIKKVCKFNFLKKIKYFALLITKFDYLQYKYCEKKTGLSKNILFNFFYTILKFREIKKYKKKCMRNSSDFEVINYQNFYVIKKRQFNIDFDFINNLNDSNSLKNGNTCSVFKYQDLVVKRYNVKGILHFLKLQFFNKRAIKSWQSSNALSLLGIPTAEPLCVIQKKKFFCVTETFFITKFIYGKNILDFMTNSNHTCRKIMLSNLNILFDLLKFHRIYHGDLKFSNILIDETNFIPQLIDLDSLTFYRTNLFFNFLRISDINRFNANFKNPIIEI